ncbi:right-handed parallel beta-helix repeat-containing protein [Roseibium sediminicola]|uniref:Right-handed parallel beta-helix repeat-containing protein n=1 Tax=Roseibium sediminicola TaxID=2933272 RepID=A0ABT0GZ23_9HYPH|nr:right-handed parallel beta-helix repeat-containing protein [Roseibium sp. CAU 1639]MCK7614677.1 right-handed parallel beta-helix repeat-containing protein [Roseibium sp. CAU 1639]
MEHSADSRTVQEVVQKLRAGDRLTLDAGNYDQPITLQGLRGTPKHPIRIRGTALARDKDDKEPEIWTASVLGNGLDFEDYRCTGNNIARVEQAAGRLPGLHYIADEAALFLKDCQWVVLEDLSFKNCWPTAVYIDNCQSLTLRRLHFREGTFAFGAVGTDTRHLLIEGCDWIQDPSGQGEADLKDLRRNQKLTPPPPNTAPGGALWSQLLWTQVHGYKAETEDFVLPDDARAYDGDFFRAWNIAGYAVFRDNCILDAFNGIHFFNTAREDEQEAYSRNILIENNWFVRIRDNAVEPEYFAINWTVRHNCFADCFAAFSFEPTRSGFYYIYGNLIWNRHRPGPENDQRNRGRVYKLGGVHEALGPHYILNNTYVLRGPLFKKKRLSDLVHMNNVVAYFGDDDEVTTNVAAPFGKGWEAVHDAYAEHAEVKASEKKRFTKFWNRLGITFDGDMINHPSFPDPARKAGYPVGVNARGYKPKFDGGAFGDPVGLRITGALDGGKEVAIPESLEVKVLAPDGAEQTVGGKGTVVGAWQAEGLFTLKDPLFVTLNPQFRKSTAPETGGDDEIGDLAVS